FYGQNVAFVLALAGPVLRRLQVHSRWALTLALLGFFGLVTRFEPSVVRATAMAGVAATATLLGRESSATRSLGLAISGLILLDPGLISSLGFRLSVAATMGILWISPGLARMFPGPRVVRETSAITVGAQLAVAPMLVTTFGSVPVASVPANLLAGPAAGPVMIWGLSGGLVAGLVGGTVGTVLHWPTGLLTRWMRWVARLAAVAPFGQLTPVPLMAATIAVTFLLVGRHRRTAAAVAIAFLLLPSVDIIAAGDGRADPTAGVAIWRAEGVTVVEVDGSATAARALAALRTEGIRSVDMVVAHEDGRRVAEVLAAVGRRHRIVAIVTASGSERDWLSLGDGEQVGIGPVVISAVGGDLVVAWAS
ncbi:MAG: ComEC/Rec2 family competence protein, partial [Acidimicrobiia bacterium]|nr:ComEC/Rec2 family competence protein [Acidimicrobiia bacterium]